MPSNKKKRVTIYDLATELDVSPSTVSRALKDHFSIGKETVAAVKELARQRGYRPNVLAANLRKQETNTIGVLVSWINRPFISSLISGIEATAREAGYNVIISQSQDSLANEIANTRTLYDSRICALIVSLAMETTDLQHFEELRASETPLVFVDRVPDAAAYQKVIIDNFRAGFEATEHLIDQGCRRIAILTGSPRQHIYRERRRGYLEALRHYGLPIDDSLIKEGHHLTTTEGGKLTRELFALSEPPDGLFSNNDMAAVGGIKYARSVGVDIPRQLAVIGLNDDPVCTLIEPQLSSVSHPAKEMGRLAVQQVLLATAQKAAAPQATINLETRVIARASSLRNP